MSFLLPKTNKQILNIGIMGGTFDPIHMGHLVTAEVARQQFKLDYVIFIPAGIPPHKDIKTINDAEHRYLMTLLAVVDNPFYRLAPGDRE